MKNIDVIKAFSNKERARSSTGSLESTGDRLYSYATCTAEYDKCGKLYINLTKYSCTTSRHQSILNRLLYGKAFVILYNIERNIVHIVPKHLRINQL